MTGEYLVSVVITGKNAASTLGECLHSILKLEFPTEKFEVIYVDAESSDGSVAIVEEIAAQHCNFNLRHFVEPGLPGRGRNKGIIESTGQIIAFTDADCAVDKSWLSNITSHLAAQDQTIVGVGGPSMTPDSDGRFAKCIGSLWQTSFGAAGARNPALYKGLRDVEHNPTCNSAYRRWVFDKVGLFHQYLPVTEDEEIDTRIRRKGYRLLYAEDVVVWHHRKNKLGSFANQMFSYGFWRANSGRKGLVPLKLMHFAPPFLVLYALMLPMLALLSPQLSIIPLAVYLVLGLASGAYGAWKSRYMTCVVVTPVLGFVEHVAYGLGFLSGLLTNRKIQG